MEIIDNNSTEQFSYKKEFFSPRGKGWNAKNEEISQKETSLFADTKIEEKVMSKGKHEHKH